VVYPVCAFLGLVALAVAHPPEWIPQGVVLVVFVATVLVGLAFAVLLSNPLAAPPGSQALPRTRPQRRAG
jgi:hypothetical protein